MQLHRYLLMAWRWWWLIVSVMVLTAGAAYLQSRRTVPVYSASATLMINQASNSAVGTITSDSIYTSQQLASTYVELLRKRAVLAQVIDDLSLSMTPAELAGSIEVASVRDTQLIVVSVEDTDPALAASLANKTAEVFQRFVTGQQLLRYASLKDSLASQMIQTENDIASTEDELDAMGTPATTSDELRASQLQATLGQYRNIYANLLTNLSEVRLAEAQTTGSVVIAETAEAPAAPVRPRTARDTALAAVLGVVLALGVVFLIEYLDDTIKTPDDIGQAVKLPTLGLIARIDGRDIQARLVAMLSPRSPISEAYRTLRTNLEFGGVDAPLRTLLVTSSDPGEGKSTTAANLAIVLAQAGKRVIALDSDLRRPMLHKYFKLSNSFGLTSALLDNQMRAVTYLQPSSIKNLSIMCSGPLPPNPAELLGSQRMGQIMDELKEQADVIVCDSPPLLAVTDAALLARQVDGTLLVAEVGSTRRNFLTRARDVLRPANVRVLGVVLNRIPLSRSRYYAYAYQYYYYYSSDGERRRHAKPIWLARFFGRNGHAQPIKPPASAIVTPPPQGQAAPNPPMPQDRAEAIAPSLGTPVAQVEAAAPTGSASLARLGGGNGHSPKVAAAPTGNALLTRLGERNEHSSEASAAQPVAQAGNTPPRRALWRIGSSQASIPVASLPAPPEDVEAVVPQVDMPAVTPEAVAQKRNGSSPRPVPPEIVEEAVPPVGTSAVKEKAAARKRNGSGPRRKKKAASAVVEEVVRESFKGLSA